ncbi:hypothetical protein [Ferrimicrobium sp.]|uniref:hypothetical protein n=1 Tax=Ferrimicrobium sp. TaxID=2926050 RepID=UPI0026169A2E|nr:hypothetical protein [Ferrimicrobium sp.]
MGGWMITDNRGIRSGDGSMQHQLHGSKHLVAAVSFLGIMSLLLGACGSSSGVSVSTPNGTVKVNTNSSGSKVTFKTSKGSEVVGASSSLPSGFPSGIPLPPHIKLVGSIATTVSGGQHYELTYSFTGSFRSELSNYAAELHAANYSDKSSYSYNGGAVQNWSSASWNITILGSSGSSGTKNSLIVTVTKPS